MSAECLVAPAAAVERLRAQGLDATERQLASWRTAELVPRLRRGNPSAGQPRWGWTRADLDAIAAALRLRQQTGDLDVLRVRLWLAGQPQDPDAVRVSLVRFADRAAGEVRRALDSVAAAVPGGAADGASADPIPFAAAALASMRGASPFPRFVRQPLPERQEGIAYLLRIALDADPDPSDEAGARAAERVLGVSRGRRRALSAVDPWLDGPATALADASRLVSLPAIRNAAATATDAELEAARPVARLLLGWLPRLVRLLAAMLNDPNPAGWGGLAAIGDGGEVTVLLVSAVVALRRAHPDGVDAIASALDEAARQTTGSLHQLLLMSDEEFAARAARVPPADASRLARVRVAFRP